MGLDMKLFCTKASPENKIVIKQQIAEWRKFNALHNWFVSSFQEDDNGNIMIESSELDRLLDEVSVSVATQVPYLKPTEGSFFGDTEIDDEYWNSCNKLIYQIKNALKSNQNSEIFIYRYSY